MKRKFDICMIMILTLTAFLLAMNGMRRRDEALATRIAPEILRFHVLANSNSPEDQALKLAVKEFLLDQLRPHAASKKEAQDYIIQNREMLEALTEDFISSEGFDYPAAIRLETCVFPEKTYGDMTFPAGTYDSVRVLIGEGAGENFWCVLYPSLCYLDSTYAVVPDASKEALEAVLPEDDFLALLDARRSVFRTVLQEKSPIAPEKIGRTDWPTFMQSSDVSDKKTEQDFLLPRITIRFKLSGFFSSL